MNKLKNIGFDFWKTIDSNEEMLARSYTKSNYYFNVLPLFNREIDNFVEGFINEISNRLTDKSLQKYKHKMTLVFKMKEINEK
mgnify:CR=1 FL=1